MNPSDPTGTAPTNTPPRIAFLLGDCTGIGPELVARVMDEGRMAAHARLVVVGDARVLERGMRDAGELDTSVAPNAAASGWRCWALTTMASAAR